MNHAIDIDEKVETFIGDNKMRVPKFGGIVTQKNINLPTVLNNAISTILKMHPIDGVDTKSAKLCRYLAARHPPIEKSVLSRKTDELQQKIMEKDLVNTEEMSIEELEKYENKVNEQVYQKMKRKIYHWKPVRYDAYTSFLYLIGRISFDYSVLYQILHEIKMRSPDFTPYTVLDFGSGVASSVWAVNGVWDTPPNEHLCVDVSNDMNTIARLLLQECDERGEMMYSGVHFRHSLPAADTNQYSLVVSAFSLLELPSEAHRLQTLLSLWRKTQDYLVLVELGTQAGFKLINEARNFILQLSSLAEDDKEKLEEDPTRSRPTRTAENLQGHVFAPCPHDMECPRLSFTDVPCNFEVKYKGRKEEATATNKSKYSYVVLKKGARSTEGVTWPRIIGPISYPSKQCHLRLCTPAGRMEHSIVTASRHGRTLFRCGKACSWGDLFPIVPREQRDRGGRRQTEHTPPICDEVMMN